MNWVDDAAVVQKISGFRVPGVEDAAVRVILVGVVVAVMVWAAKRLVREEVAVARDVEYPMPNVTVSPSDLFTALQAVTVDVERKVKIASFSEAVGFSIIH